MFESDMFFETGVDGLRLSWHCNTLCIRQFINIIASNRLLVKIFCPFELLNLPKKVKINQSAVA